jgi:hypothetical protein
MLLVAATTAGFVLPTQAARLKPEAVTAFNRYIAATEAQMADDLREGRFLAIDRLTSTVRQKTYAQLRQGQIYIQQLHTHAGGKPIQVPGGLLHHLYKNFSGLRWIAY